MSAPGAKLPFTRRLSTFAGIAMLATAACAPQAAAPTAAPAPPAPTVAPAKPAPTTAPAKPAPTAATAPKPAPTAAPAAKPTEKPVAKAAGFDEKAVADFYKGKTVRIVVGYGPGGPTDLGSRLFQKALPRYLPGSPTVVVENKAGAGSMLAANTVYNSEPRDGTVMAAFSGDLVLQQAISAKGVQFDSGKYNWLGSTYSGFRVCAARTDSGVNSIQDIMGEGGKELSVASYGKGTDSFNSPAALNAALGARFKIVPGYESGATQVLAVKNKEVQGWCTSVDSMRLQSPELLDGANPAARIIVVMGDETSNHPWLQGAPAAEKLARTEEGKALLRAVNTPARIELPHALPPEVPRDRVEALRRARDKAYADPEFREGAEKVQLALSPRTGEDLTQIVQGLLSTPPAVLAKLKDLIE